MTNNELKKYIKEIQPKYNYKKVILFGSRARGTNKNDSDIDLLVEFYKKEDNSLFNIIGIINDIEKKFNLKVDAFSYPINRRILNRGFIVDKEIVVYE